MTNLVIKKINLTKLKMSKRLLAALMLVGLVALTGCTPADETPVVDGEEVMDDESMMDGEESMDDESMMDGEESMDDDSMMDAEAEMSMEANS